MVLERILLQTIKFDLQVEHPYMFLLRYVKQLKGGTGFVQNRCPNGVQKDSCFVLVLQETRTKYARCSKWPGPSSMTGKRC